MSERIAIYPGSFDPTTLGHLDILERAKGVFDHVVVAVLDNPSKQPLFSTTERVALLRDSIPSDWPVTVGTFGGLTVEYARIMNATAIVRGLRATSDFEAEFQMGLMNRRLAPEIHTVFFMTSFANVFVSSSIIKEVCQRGGDVDALVPSPVAVAMRAKFHPSSLQGAL